LTISPDSAPLPDSTSNPPEACHASPALYVAVGASAGGLEAIDLFFSNMAHDSGLAFIVIQHLSPDHKSLMKEILSKKTAMPVHRAEDGMRVLANNVYLIPPKKTLTIQQGHLVVRDQEHVRGTINLPIDMFLHSLAQDQADKAVAVILSGTGSDGMRGVRGIKEFGGMVMVQKEESAKFDGMPRSAISTGLADFILSPAEMPEDLLAYMRHPYVAKSRQSAIPGEDEDVMTRIFSVLRDQFKVDFTQYRATTISRRIQRRMSINRLDQIHDYLTYLQTYPSEAATLFRELLIGVTRFFRDPAVFDALSQTWLPELLRRNRNQELRFWVAGCSTGEEAYTLAMLIKEAMLQANVSRDVKIFSTDIDRDAILFAANGKYPESIVADVPPDLLSRHFHKSRESYQVARNIREMVVFAQHNLIKDPPFTRIDCITCRNLLIYLQPKLQQKVLQNFNFSLNPNGLLLLGTSETIGEMGEFFTPLDQKGKIFKTTGRLSHPAAPRSMDALPQDFNRRGVRKSLPADSDRLLERLTGILDQELPLTAVVNEQMEVLHIIGDTSAFFRVPSGKASSDISKMAVKELTIPLSTGIQKVFRSNEAMRFSNIRIGQGDQTKVVDLRITPLPCKKNQDPLVAVFLSETVTAPNGAAPFSHAYDLTHEAEQRISDLEQELQFNRENLQATVEELETSNEELQATNEELLASNEELQSTNEELQATNEELYTVNTEYQTKITELSQLHMDIDNLLNASQIGLLLLDENMEIRRFSPKILDFFHLRDSDIGRPLVNMTHQLVEVDPFQIIEEVQASGKMAEQDVRTRDGRWHLMRVAPYAVTPSIFSGTLVSFMDFPGYGDASNHSPKTADS
jgi:two-component system, chemotaxis family, CheB/CheR fusion protein